VYAVSAPTGNARRRAYDNAGRAEQAAANRRRILAAAHRVLVERGYASTTINAIAAEARVSRELIYKAFGSKPALVKRLYDVQLVGDDEPLPLHARPEWRAMMAEPTASALLIRYAAIVRGLYERLGPLLGVLLLAARSGEPDLKAFGDETDQQRLVGSGRIVDAVVERDGLRTGLDRARGTDLVWAFNSPDMYQLLRAARGWSPDDYESWLGRSLVDALLERR
jgi:AcrR family transcriptional regulator